jgi:hypothetical protein
MYSGTAPKTYHKKAVKPAHNAAELNSPSSGLQFTFRSYPKVWGLRRALPVYGLMFREEDPVVVRTSTALIPYRARQPNNSILGVKNREF